MVRFAPSNKLNEVELIIDTEGGSVPSRDPNPWYEHSNEKQPVSVSDWDDRQIR